MTGAVNCDSPLCSPMNLPTLYVPLYDTPPNRYSVPCSPPLRNGNVTALSCTAPAQYALTPHLLPPRTTHGQARCPRDPSRCSEGNMRRWEASFFVSSHLSDFFLPCCAMMRSRIARPHNALEATVPSVEFERVGAKYCTASYLYQQQSVSVP